MSEQVELLLAAVRRRIDVVCETAGREPARLRVSDSAPPGAPTVTRVVPELGAPEVLLNPDDWAELVDWHRRHMEENARKMPAQWVRVDRLPAPPPQKGSGYVLFGIPVELP